MRLFGRGRGDALRRFLIDNGAGADERFWRLAQSLSALYPGGMDEKRWVDGVLAIRPYPNLPPAGRRDRRASSLPLGRGIFESRTVKGEHRLYDDEGG